VAIIANWASRIIETGGPVCLEFPLGMGLELSKKKEWIYRSDTVEVDGEYTMNIKSERKNGLLFVAAEGRSDSIYHLIPD
jgi:hypothetical protein